CELPLSARSSYQFRGQRIEPDGEAFEGFCARFSLRPFSTCGSLHAIREGEGENSMYRALLCTLLITGGLAVAQDPPMSEKPPTGSKAKDRSTAQTAGESNRMQNMAS